MGSTHTNVSFLFGLNSASIQIVFRTIYRPSCCLVAVAYIKCICFISICLAQLIEFHHPTTGHQILHNIRAKYYGTKQEHHVSLKKESTFLISKCWLKKGITLCNQKLALPCLIIKKKTEKHHRSINSLNRNNKIQHRGLEMLNDKMENTAIEERL